LKIRYEKKSFALEFIKRLVLAWDPDFTKLTSDERKRLEEAENGEYLMRMILIGIIYQH
jgi:hypothetical protein